jgi:hypothetical protein
MRGFNKVQRIRAETSSNAIKLILERVVGWGVVIITGSAVGCANFESNLLSFETQAHSVTALQSLPLSCIYRREFEAIFLRFLESEAF